MAEEASSSFYLLSDNSLLKEILVTSLGNASICLQVAAPASYHALVITTPHLSAIGQSILAVVCARESSDSVVLQSYSLTFRALHETFNTNTIELFLAD